MNPPAAVALRVPGLTTPLRLFVHGEQDRHVSQRIRERGIWEPFETSLLLALLRPGDVFVDVGANIGYFTVLAASCVGDTGHVFAFEPDPDNYRLLQANTALNDCAHRVTALEAALSDTPGDGRLFRSLDNLGDHRVYAGDEARDSLPIALVRGSDVLAGRLRRLDLLKVDTQGAEFHVIAGLLPLLRTLPQPPRVLIELTPHALREAGASGRALIELLATLREPMWIIDHTEGRLHASSAEALALWCDNWDAVPQARGFMNILVGAVD